MSAEQHHEPPPPRGHEAANAPLDRLLDELLAQLQCCDEVDEELRARLLAYWEDLVRHRQPPRPAAKRTGHRQALAVALSCAASLAAVLAGLALLQPGRMSSDQLPDATAMRRRVTAPHPRIAPPVNSPANPSPQQQQHQQQQQNDPVRVADQQPREAADHPTPSRASRTGTLGDMFAARFVSALHSSKRPALPAVPRGVSASPIRSRASGHGDYRVRIRRACAEGRLAQLLRSLTRSSHGRGEQLRLVGALASAAPVQRLWQTLAENHNRPIAPLLAAALLTHRSRLGAHLFLKWWAAAPADDRLRQRSLQLVADPPLLLLADLAYRRRNQPAFAVLVALARNNNHAYRLWLLARRRPDLRRVVVACLVAAGQERILSRSSPQRTVAWTVCTTSAATATFVQHRR